MNIRISFRGMDHSQAMETYARQALEKVLKLVEKEENLQIEMLIEAHQKSKHHKVEVRLTSKNHRCIAEHEGPDTHREIDYVVKTLGEDIKKKKGKMLDKRNQGPTNRPKVKIADSFDDEDDDE